MPSALRFKRILKALKPIREQIRALKIAFCREIRLQVIGGNLHYNMDEEFDKGTQTCSDAGCVPVIVFQRRMFTLLMPQ